MSTAGRVLAAVDRHWFEPVSLRDYGVVRMVLVGFQLALVLGVPFEWYVSLGVQLELVRRPVETFQPIPSMQLLMLPFGGRYARPDVALVVAMWGLAVVSGALAFLGVRTRLTLPLFAFTTTLMQAHAYSFSERHHPEGVLVLALWVLALAPVGGWSAARIWRGARDRLRGGAGDAGDDRSPHARWPLRTVQWLFALIYLSAFISKTERSGLDWYNGYTLTYYMLQDGVLYDMPLGLWLSHHLEVARVLSVLTGVFEATFVLAVLVPVLSVPYVVVGTLFHVGIFAIQKAPFFHFIVTYVVFLPELRTGARIIRERLTRLRGRMPSRPLAAAGDVR